MKPSHMPGITLCPLIPRCCHPLPLPASPLLHPPLPWMGRLHLSCPVVSRRSWGPWEGKRPEGGGSLELLGYTQPLCLPSGTSSIRLSEA